MTYSGKPLFEEQFPPAFDTVNNKYEEIKECRVVRINSNYEITTSPGGGQYGVTLEKDGATGSSFAFAALHGNNVDALKGSNVEVAVRMAGTARVSCAGAVKRGEYLIADNTGRVKSAGSSPDATMVVGQAKEDGAIGSRILMRFNGMSYLNTVIQKA